MTPQQFRRSIAKLGLSQVAAARFLGVSERMVRRWVASRDPQPIPIAYAYLLNLMIRFNVKPEDVR